MEMFRLLIVDTVIILTSIYLERKYGGVSRILANVHRFIDRLIYKFGKKQNEPQLDPTRTRSLHEIRAASHEAGHAVTAWMSPYVSKIESITVSSDGSGKVLYKRFYSGSPSLWYDLVISLAGVTAELISYKRFRSGQSKEDLLCAKDLAEKLAAQDSVKPPWSDDLSDIKFDLSKVFRKGSVDEKTLKILNLGLAKARQLLIKNSELFDKTTKTILTKSNLNDSDVQELFGPRFWHFR